MDAHLETKLPASPADAFLERLAERLGTHARASAVFADPVERDGVTVIPVARVRWGFGGGAGGRGSDAEQGAGGGGGVIVSPVGYIELKDGQTRFRPIRAPAARLPAILGGGLLLLLLLQGIARLIGEP